MGLKQGIDSDIDQVQIKSPLLSIAIIIFELFFVLHKIDTI